MLRQVFGTAAQRRLRNSPTLSESIDEAASQSLGKTSKIDVATDAIFLEDLRELAENERESVQHYKRKQNLAPPVSSTANGKTKGRNMQRNLIVCDDYRVGNNLLTGVLVTVFALAVTIIAGIALWPQSEAKSDSGYSDTYSDMETWKPVDADGQVAE